MITQNNSIEQFFDDGSRLFKIKKYSEAKSCYEHILAADPMNVRALHASGVVAFHMHDTLAALDFMRLSLRIDPEYIKAYLSLSKIRTGLGFPGAAKTACLKGLEVAPQSAELLCELGTVCRDLGQLDTAQSYLENVLEHRPIAKEVYYEYGLLMLREKRSDAAMNYFLKALTLDLGYAEAYEQLALIYLAQGAQEKAVQCLDECLQFKPDSITIRTVKIFVLNYLQGVTQAEIYAVSRGWAELLQKNVMFTAMSHHNRPDPEKVLRIGFVSPDFRQHPVGYFVQSFMLLHDIEHLEVYCYSDVRCEDDITALLIDSSDVWRRVFGVRDEKVAEIICNDRIDILVDLAGHTKDNRLAMFLMKPAPIQVTWAGYVGTTGLSAIDYLISDKYQSPPEAQQHTVEKIFRMPNDYICYTPPDFAPDVASLPAVTNGYVTFGSFNNLAKVSESAVALWCKVLKRVNGSRLFLKNPSFSDASNVSRWLDVFKEQGIAADRIIFEGFSPQSEMLERYSCIDIQLDTLPYSGGLTTLESLWMGVPVVTLPGELFSSRHSLSHLMNAGLPELVATSEDEYVSIACRLAEDLEKLSKMRSFLREMLASSPVCDGFTFAEDLHVFFRTVWREWCERHIHCAEFSDYNMFAEINQKTPVGDHIELNTQGNSCSDKNDYEGAIYFYKKAIDIKPGYVEAYYNLALVYHKAGYIKEAAKMYCCVITILPDFLDAYVNLSALYIEQEMFDDAIDICKSGTDFLLKSPKLCFNYARAYIEMKHFAEAETWLHVAIGLKPDYQQAAELLDKIRKKW